MNIHTKRENMEKGLVFNKSEVSIFLKGFCNEFSALICFAIIINNVFFLTDMIGHLIIYLHVC